MRIATWNVNSVKARLPVVLDVLKAIDCDVVALQELKCTDDTFPFEAIEDAGYTAAVHGQKTYNGVALLSRFPLEDVRTGLPGDESDEEARYIEAWVDAPEGCRVASLYCPNGNPAPGPKYDYKLAWMRRLDVHAAELLALEEPLVLAGDYNIIPREEDVWAPERWTDDALFRPESRDAYRRLVNGPLTDAFMAMSGAPAQYTFWDYQGGAWPRDHGIRIDHLLCSPEAALRLRGVEIHRRARDAAKPSDHGPVIAEFGD